MKKVSFVEEGESHILDFEIGFRFLFTTLYNSIQFLRSIIHTLETLEKEKPENADNIKDMLFGSVLTNVKIASNIFDHFTAERFKALELEEQMILSKLLKDSNDIKMSLISLISDKDRDSALKNVLNDLDINLSKN